MPVRLCETDTSCMNGRAFSFAKNSQYYYKHFQAISAKMHTSAQCAHFRAKQF